MKKILLFSVCLLFIGNYLSAQAIGDYRSNSLIPANWNVPATWERWNGAAWVVADYPGQSTPAGAVTIQNGNIITLNVSPANAVASIAIQGGVANTALFMSDGFILNVTGLVQVNPPTADGARTGILINGASAQLNCGSLTFIESGNDSRVGGLGLTAGTINVTGNVTMGATQPLRTVVEFNPTGTLNVGGNISGGTIASTTGISAVNVVGNLNAVTINPGTTATTNISGNLVNPKIMAGAGTLNIAGNMDNPTVNPVFTGTINFNGNGVQQIIGDATFTNLGMTNATSTLQFLGNITVTGTLTLTAGKINLGSNLLALTNATPANQLVGGSGSSYVYTTSAGGRLIRQNLAPAIGYNFPIGTPTDYLPVTVTPTTVSNFAMSAYSPAATNGTVGGPPFINKSRIVDAMWSIERTVGTGNASITIQWAGALEGASFASFGDGQIGISRNAGGTWLPAIATSANATANTVTATFNAFTMFGVGEINIALPLKFGSINAYKKQAGIQLDWKVYSENKVKNYDVERSADARSFSTVGSLPALYNTTGGDYGFLDAAPLPVTSYYRIKSNDMDGRSSYSPVIRINNTNINSFSASITPNPAASVMNLSIEGVKEKEILVFEIMNASGMIVHRENISAGGTTMVKSLPRPAVSAGLYFYKITRSNKETFNGKLVLQ